MNVEGSTAVYAVLGKPVRHSQSPRLHNGWFSRCGVNAVYVALESDAPASIGAAFLVGIAGLNVTTPLKSDALAAAVSADATALRTGAANLLLRRVDGWHAVNTDVEGLCRSIEQVGVRIEGRRVVVLGSGGAARAAVVGLAARGAASVDVLARRPEAARQVADLVGGDSGPIESGGLAGRDLVVVATSGRAESVGLLDPARLRAGAVWVDLNYWDPDPPASSAARAAGCVVLDGSGMLLHQAALSFEAWTGIPLEGDVWRTASASTAMG